MKLAYYVNYINHHRIVLAEEFYKLLGDDFVLIATRPFDPKELKGGEDYSKRTYCLLAAESDVNYALAMKYAREAEICSFSTAASVFAIERAKHGRKDGVVFETGERWLKKGLINLLSPRLLKWWWTYQIIYRKAGFYKLCASAYAATDHYNMLTYRNRCYKWGYFTRVETSGCETAVEASTDVSTAEVTPLMWCSRFLLLKHPELPILMAGRLKENGYKFHLDMYGEGEYRGKAETMVESLNLSDVVSFHNNRPNDEILADMRKHEIFLFTSDRNEGWGAVANESMANGCVLVASDAIGSTPYLVKEGVNGLGFKSAKTTSSFNNPDMVALNSLCEKVMWLLEHPERRLEMRKSAVRIIHDFWSPRVAAKNLLQLASDLKTLGDTSIKEGPCSKALPIEK